MKNDYSSFYHFYDNPLILFYMVGTGCSPNSNFCNLETCFTVYLTN